MILSMSRSELKNTGHILLGKSKIILKVEFFFPKYSSKAAVWNSCLCIANSDCKSNHSKWLGNVVWFSTKVRFSSFAVSFRQK